MSNITFSRPLTFSADVCAALAADLPDLPVHTGRHFGTDDGEQYALILPDADTYAVIRIVETETSYAFEKPERKKSETLWNALLANMRLAA